MAVFRNKKCSQVYFQQPVSRLLNNLIIVAGWNMLFFLWGVFRGRRINQSDSAEKNCISCLNMMPVKKDFPSAIMTLSEIHCSPTRMDDKSIAGDRTCMVLPSTSLDQNQATVTRNSDVQESNPDQTHSNSHGNLEQDAKMDTKPTSSSLASGAQFCQELKSTGSSMVMFISLYELFSILMFLFTIDINYVWCTGNGVSFDLISFPLFFYLPNFLNSMIF